MTMSPTLKRRRDEVEPAPEDWCTIENEPAVFHEIAQNIGADMTTVNEVFDLTSINQNALGLIFTVKLEEEEDEDEDEEDHSKTTEQNPASASADVFFISQIVNNVCATLALLSILFNIDTRFDIGDHLKDFKQNNLGATPEERGVALGKDILIRDTHNSFASAQTRAQARAEERERNTKKKRGRAKKARDVDIEDEVVYHYISYVSVGGHVWEMNGLEKGPRDLGPHPTDDWLSVVRPYLMEKMGDCLESTLMEVVPRNRDDVFENQRVDEWLLDNTRRKNDYTTFFQTLIRHLHGAKEIQL
ncbi:ubiquitin carboxyl-terminal hydrolase [Syncephalastrum racemosum]|uniref:ubiquitinyl hydrolase 1 n=1 Tax=Syncephalastrum racemosum TaxID=13706 RepID=A0A1X2H7N8_SYNRA|nr:ubiquitin carboxyl-terminal hydrolase [Syncephalastrum racemosum]